MPRSDQERRSISGLLAWVASGISIQTIGLILVVVGIAWLLIELVQARGWRRRDPVVRDRPVVSNCPPFCMAASRLFASPT
jgi:hypothetical protein